MMHSWTDLWERYSNGEFSTGDIREGLSLYRKEIKSLSIRDSSLAKDLELANEREEFALLEFLLSIAAAFPSNEYVPVLCTILNHLNPRIPNENIVSLLSKLADERALPVLKKAAYANLLSDEGRHLNRKCVWALWKIGTPKALEILKDIAVNSPFESVREDAYEAIEDFTEL